MSQKTVKKKSPDPNRTHIRRCHHCGGITEKQGELVMSCDHCHKPMAPFYFFNEEEVEPLSESVAQPEYRPRVTGERRPVRGFTAYW